MKTTTNKAKAADVLREFFSANAGRLFFSVAQTAELTGVSASRIRELLPSLEEFGVQSEQGAHYKVYGMRAIATGEGPAPETNKAVRAIHDVLDRSKPTKVDHSASNSTIAKFLAEEEAKADKGEAREEENNDPTACPFCSSINFVPAGQAGTFLGDAGLICNDCNKSWNKLTGQELPAAEKKKRKAPMNPQYKINAKVDAVHKAGYSLSYEKATRRWALTTVNGGSIEMTAQEFSLHTPESLVDMSSK